MADKFIDTNDVDAIIGEEVRKRLFKDEGDADYVSAKFDRAAELASSLARAAMLNAGYDVSGTSSDNDTVKSATMAIFLRIAYARKQESPPGDLVAMYDGLLESIRIGEVPIPGLTPDTEHAVGGYGWSEYDSSVEGAKTPRFKDLDKYVG